MVGCPSWILVHDGDQFGDGVFAITNHMGRFASAGGDEFFANDQESIVIPFGELLNDHRIPLGLSGFEGGIDLLTGEEIQGNGTALIAVAGFDDDRQADLKCGRPSIVDILGRTPARNGQASLMEEDACQVLVLDDVLSDGACLTGGCGEDFLLFPSPTELDE